MSSTIYTASFPLPDLVEIGKPQVVTCPVLRDGVFVTPSSGAVSIVAPSGETKVSGVTTIDNGVSEYEIAANALSGEDYGEGWRIAWALVLDGDTFTFENEMALVRTRLYPVISDRDLYERVSSLDPSGPKNLSSRTTYQPYLDGAWRQIQRRLIGAGRRPWLVMSPSALSEVHLTLTLALIFEDLATRLNDAFEVRAQSYRQQYEAAWKMLSFRYDETSGNGGSNGGGGDTTRKTPRAPIFLMRRD